MAEPALKSKRTTKIKKQETNLKGTLASVLLLGIFLVIVWVSIYFLFTDRLG
ncbi:cytochrome c oxidase subunit 2A [Peribacillus sp. NPDC097675]|uniref:cytochrome c oxidase subunit 2A n=1 Tax=Peribacillus sp. NPDC097675 TaxID=3390618 RepID=UPI003D013B78